MGSASEPVLDVACLAPARKLFAWIEIELAARIGTHARFDGFAAVTVCLLERDVATRESVVGDRALVAHSDQLHTKVGGLGAALEQHCHRNESQEQPPSNCNESIHATSVKKSLTLRQHFFA